MLALLFPGKQKIQVVYSADGSAIYVTSALPEEGGKER